MGKQVKNGVVQKKGRKISEAPPILWGLDRTQLAAPETPRPHRPSLTATGQKFPRNRGPPPTSPHSRPPRRASAPRSQLVPNPPPSPEERVSRGRLPRGLLRDPASRDLRESEETQEPWRRSLTTLLPCRNPGNGNGSYSRCPSPPQRLPQRHWHWDRRHLSAAKHQDGSPRGTNFLRLQDCVTAM